MRHRHYSALCHRLVSLSLRFIPTYTGLASAVRFLLPISVKGGRLVEEPERPVEGKVSVISRPRTLPVGLTNGS
jgi:hypothetical protein